MLTLGLLIGVIATNLINRSESPQAQLSRPDIPKTKPKRAKPPLTAINKQVENKKPATRSKKRKPPINSQKLSQKKSSSNSNPKTSKPAQNPVPVVGELDKKWRAFRNAPEDMDKMEAFSQVFRKEIRNKLSGATKTTLLRRVQLAEMQANIEQFEDCFRSYKEATN